MHWITLAHDAIQWRALVSIAMNMRPFKTFRLYWLVWKVPAPCSNNHSTEHEPTMSDLEVLTAASMKTTAFCNTAPWNLVEIYRRFRGAYCLHHQGHRLNDGGSTRFWNVTLLQRDYTAMYPKRLSSGPTVLTRNRTQCSKRKFRSSGILLKSEIRTYRHKNGKT
jgi:hypothetical protein